MARTFDATDDNIVLGVGSTGTLGPYTYFCLVKMNGDGASGNFMLSRSASANIIRFSKTAGNLLNLLTSVGNVSATSTTNIVAADGWCLVGVSKASGTVNPRFYRYKFTSPTWARENAVGTLANGTGTAASFRLGATSGSTFPINADIAAAVMFNRVLSDAETELLPGSYAAWFALAPSAVWILDQDVVSTHKVLDWTGNGANEASGTGTTVSSVGPPISYGGDVLLPMAVPAAGGAFTQGLAGALTLAGQVSCPSGRGDKRCTRLRWPCGDRLG